MFNIKNKVYVAFASQVNLLQDRVIILDPAFSSVAFDVLANPADPASVGVVYKYASLDELISSEFNNSYADFFTFIDGETKLYIAASTSEYTKLFATVLLELQNTFSIGDAYVDIMVDKHRLKEFFLQSDEVQHFMPVVDGQSQFEDGFAAEKLSYIPTGTLYSTLDVAAVPFEIVYALYRWGYITKSDANVKVASLADLIFSGQVRSLMQKAISVLGRSTVVIQTYLNDMSIVTEDDVINAINTNGILRSAFIDHNYDLTNTAIFDEIISLCQICINNDFDYQANATQDLAELDMYKDLYIQKDIDLIIPMVQYNMVGNGFISNRPSKFNGLLLMHDYTA